MCDLENVSEILNFWFGDLTENGVPSSEKQELWWSKDPEIDLYIKNNYEKYINSAVSGKLDHWKKTSHGLLAYIIILDQFSRNIYRNSKRAFSQDKIALNTASEAVSTGLEAGLKSVEKIFLYMPYMHSEMLSDQLISIKKYSDLVNENKSHIILHDLLEQSEEYAYRHYEIIKKFGRYPHRNIILGRESTNEEIEFLRTGGSSF